VPYPVVNAAIAPTGTVSLTQPVAGYREFELHVNHAPFERQVDSDEVAREMLIWGDIDPNCNERIQATEATSRWLPYMSHRQLVASAGPGTKVVNVKLRNDNGTSAVLTLPGDTDTDTPMLLLPPTLTVGTDIHASLLWICYRRGVTLTGWSPSHTCAQTFFGLHKVDRPTYPDRVDVGYGGPLTAGQYIEMAIPPPPANKSEYRILIMQLNVVVNGVSDWYPASTAS
jgi:hypothetical protein